MNTRSLERFAQAARRQLHEQVAAKLERVLARDSAASREHPVAVRQLQEQIAGSSRKAVVEKVAYTWFNRFCALRYMDANHYTRMGTVSPSAGNTQPELLQEAKQGYIDDELPVDRDTVFGLLNGRLPSPDPQQEAYRLLLVGVCNHYHTVMPFLFERIDDFTELLMPDDLLSEGSILQAVRDALTPAACEDVEVIGWLYQFYISEKKDDVIGSKRKIEAADIPAATQLFTPHWIVRFLVENSLGRLWMLNRPNSKLAEQMDYYIRPDSAADGHSERSEESFLRVDSPEELRICDPAAGSGHMLTYAFDLLYAIYEEEGYNPTDIPRLILERNLYGMEIDERAGALAAFALVMKARGRDRRFFRRMEGDDIKPNICVLRPIVFEEGELSGETWIQEVGDAKEALLHDLHLFREADNFGSLLRPQLSAEQLEALRWHMQARTAAAQADWLEKGRRDKIARALQQAEYLARSYHVVVANPPYMGSGNMNDDLKEFARGYYPDSKSDLFAMFMERGLELAQRNGYNAMVTMESWMFLSSYETLRANLLNRSTIPCMVHMPYLGKGGTPMGINFGTAAAVFANRYREGFKGHYSCVRYYETDDEYVPLEFPVQNERLARASAADFKKIPGSPIAYWASSAVRTAFATKGRFSRYFETREGLTTGSNDFFLRFWHEVSMHRICFDAESEADAAHKGRRWFPYIKGGDYRKWAGNYEYVVNWYRDGAELKVFSDPRTGRIRSHNYNGEYAFQPGLTWTGVSSSSFSSRNVPPGFMFDAKGPMAFPRSHDFLSAGHGFLNSSVTDYLLEMLAPTLDFKLGHILNLPFDAKVTENVTDGVMLATQLSHHDWDSLETSWGYSVNPLVFENLHRSILHDNYAELRRDWSKITNELQMIEASNNRVIIEAYGLQDELTPDVPLEEITLTCNPHYRYGGVKSEEELEALLRADTVREFISYAVGCMFGRYSLDKPGLILANQGETLDDYLRQVPNPTFAPDKDNVLPLLDGDWFSDDIVERFKRFLRTTFGEEHFQENLAFIEDALGRDIRSYFLREFYTHHLKLYKKRPIYWLFSSPNGSFNALIYMHRYRPDTVSLVLNDYLREFRTKLQAHRRSQEAISLSESAPQRDRTAALKEMERVDKVLRELRAYEDEVLYPLATQRIEIDLDDGVKVNYNKFGEALKRVPGLSEYRRDSTHPKRP